MNIKKMIGLGLLAALVGCQDAPQGVGNQGSTSQSTLFVIAPSPSQQGRGSSRQGNIPQSQGQGSFPQGGPQGQGSFPQGGPQGQGQGQGSFPQGGPQGQGQGSFPQGVPQGQGQGQGSLPQGGPQGQGFFPQGGPPQWQGNGNYPPPPPPQGNGPIISTSGHIHTDDNKAGGHPDGDVSKRHWTSPTGEHHESEESSDKSGNHHQVHRWTDKEGISHETDHWTDDSTGSTHQCHRWIDKEGTTHEAVHVTKQDGSVASEHFSKDKDGNIKKEDDNGPNGNGGPSVEPIVHTQTEASGSIVHSPDCAVSRPNLSTNS